ncbi:putative DEAD-box ATP-dependent RNA helicase 29 [Phytophthora fragariae]|uniref:RNA helicase n=1 Tax=Phytophthora fragariae TaxID=53985 RepID=A0A6A3X4R8_9STRA|nr:putative DEAD-box ATP-dependent RNA helicase 29 [Phytophthora fragariae]KAE8925929.1 putative DEAD-box ATP-dependent RNA helicase 29 [Phytophthora fragariae]KAE9082367.1 putative DEAD-box ATP-dependent RNA helicase 29 [Phytophthora fragariae]KAE9084133.1 putative DEAD-box ATP-dependent RNA helicase 29 [Phytophthora fragariae]KAE9095026.1 putative DEAD-box ATP-dependent RNA helicase 29 [Phytophthora fragariae]
MASDDLLKKGKKKGASGGADGGTTHGKSSGKGAGVGGFQHLGLSPLVFRGVMAMGYKVPTPIQRKSLPIVLSGKDCVAMARTGSGKTAAFLIPMVEKLKEHSTKIGVRAVVLSPTRELAVQTLRFTKLLSKFTSLKLALIVGGEGMDQQFEAIAANPDVLVATPGRLMHLLQEIPDFNLKAVEYVVFDEADRIFEMGFAEQLQEILKNMPTSRQTLLFSATLPKALVQFARAGLSDPELIRLDVENKISENLKMAFFTVRSLDKPALFLYMVREFLPKDDQTIVFAATRHHVEFLHALLAANHIEASCAYGDMDQASRKINLGKFRAKKTNLLIVTDVAARGIDIPLLNNVLNYSFPPTAKLFVHRVGRAARAGRSGTAFSFVDPDETPFMVDLHLYIGRRLEDSSPEESPTTKPYSLDEMRVEDVHYGAFPNELIDQENEAIQELMRSHPQVSPLVKVCDNAYKAYARTRADPSKLSIRRGKELVVKKVHPLFQKQYVLEKSKADKAAYIDSLQTFRPPQTIFEIAAGAHTSAKRSSPGVQMMVKKRKLHGKIIATETTKAADKAKAKEETAAINAAADEEEAADVAGEGLTSIKKQKVDGENAEEDAAEEAAPASKKKTFFLSKHERKQLKKRVAAGEKEEDVMKAFAAAKEQEVVSASKDEEDGEDASTFKDDENYIGYMKDGDYTTEGFLSKNADGGKVNSFAKARLEEAILDVNPDEAIEMNKKRRILHWDVRKKKFVKTTAGELTSQGTLKRRNESGVSVRKKQVGEVYRKWQQKQHKRVAGGGVEVDDDDDTSGRKLDYRNGRKPRGGAVMANRSSVNKFAKDELMSEGKIRKEEKRKARSRGVKVTSGVKSKRGKGNIKGKSHGAPTRSKAIIKKR